MSYIPLPRSQSRWILEQRPTVPGKIRLFCFPYAGGGTAIFRGWQQHLGPDIELAPVQLPGRGVRNREPFITDMREMIDALIVGLKPHLHAPYAFFGHSMGALISHELTMHLLARGDTPPVLLGVSARQAPDVASRLAHTRGMDDEEFIRTLGDLSGQTVELLSDPALRSLTLPVLRADFLLCESWEPRPVVPLDIPIAAFAGSGDEKVGRSRVDAWRRHTNKQFTMDVIPGDHFFIHSAGQQICARIRGALACELPSDSRSAQHL